MAYGLTLAGFVIKPYIIIQQELQASMQAIFGSDLDVSDTSNAGQLINKIALDQSNLWEIAQALYAAFNPDTATGKALDDDCARVNVFRLPATQSYVWAMLYGTLGTVIPQGHLVKQLTTGVQFYANALVTIAQAITGDVIIGVDSAAIGDYIITINGTPYTYPSVGTSVSAIIIGLIAALGTIANITITNIANTTLEIEATDGVTSFSLLFTANLNINKIGCPSLYYAVNDGAVSVPLNSVDTIVNAISGLTAVSNLVQGTIGRDLETDDNLRIRRRNSAQAVNGTDASIAARILANVAGVTSASVISNRTDITNGSGRPPHSFEAIVQGGLAQDIVNEIWADMPSGIATYGNTSGSATDSQGVSHTINFSIPSNLYIWVQLTVTRYIEELFPIDGDAEIVAAIYAWSLTEFSAGKDVIWPRLYSPIYSVPGVGDVTIQLATGTLITPGAYATADIPVSSEQIAVFDPSRISVTP